MINLEVKMREMKMGELFIKDFLTYIKKEEIYIDSLNSLNIEIDKYEELYSLESEDIYLNNENSSFESIAIQENQYNGDSLDNGGYSMEYENKRF